MWEFNCGVRIFHPIPVFYSRRPTLKLNITTSHNSPSWLLLPNRQDSSLSERRNKRRQTNGWPGHHESGNRAGSLQRPPLPSPVRRGTEHRRRTPAPPATSIRGTNKPTPLERTCPNVGATAPAQEVGGRGRPQVRRRRTSLSVVVVACPWESHALKPSRPGSATAERQRHHRVRSAGKGQDRGARERALAISVVSRSAHCTASLAASSWATRLGWGR